MMEVVRQEDGRFAVCAIGGSALDPVLGVFDTQEEADEWMLNQSLLSEDNDSGLGIQKPGGNQGLR